MRLVFLLLGAAGSAAGHSLTPTTALEGAPLTASGALADAANYLCYRSAIALPIDATCSPVGGGTAVLISDATTGPGGVAAVCAAASVATLTWTDATQLQVSVIECSGVDASVGAATTTIMTHVVASVDSLDLATVPRRTVRTLTFTGTHFFAGAASMPWVKIVGPGLSCATSPPVAGGSSVLTWVSSTSATWSANIGAMAQAGYDVCFASAQSATYAPMTSNVALEILHDAMVTGSHTEVVTRDVVTTVSFVGSHFVAGAANMPWIKIVAQGNACSTGAAILDGGESVLTFVTTTTATWVVTFAAAAAASLNNVVCYATTQNGEYAALSSPTTLDVVSTAPTAAPTVAPTSSPTYPLCHPGEYFDTDVPPHVCKECAVGLAYPNVPSSNIGQHATLDVTSCVDCAAGMYAPFTRMHSCIECVPGRFVANTAQSVCDECTIGHACPTTGMNDPIACGVTRFCTAGTILPRAVRPRRYKVSTDHSAQLRSAAGSKSVAGVSSLCVLGRYTDTTGEASCIECDIGRFANSAGLTECTACVAGTKCVARGTETAVACAVTAAAELPAYYCPDGAAAAIVPKWYVATVDAASITKCVPGDICSGGVADLCPVGRFARAQTVGSASLIGAECQDCWPGRYSDTVGSTGCTGCPAGFTCESSGTSVPLDCTAPPANLAEYCPVRSVTKATVPLGYVRVRDVNANRALGSDGIAVCGTGFECNSGVKVECAAGSFADVVDAHECQPCPIGRFSENSGLSVCEDCPLGTYCPQGSSMPTNCDSTSELCGVASVMVQFVPVGTVNDGTHTRLDTCAVGHECVAGVETQCSEGKYAEAGHASCEKCLAGRFSASPGSGTCDECSAGSVCKEGFSSETSCVTMRQPFTPSGSTTCGRCESGYYINHPSISFVVEYTMMPTRGCTGMDELPTATGITVEEAKAYCSSIASCTSFENMVAGCSTGCTFQFSTSCIESNSISTAAVDLFIKNGPSNNENWLCWKGDAAITAPVVTCEAAGATNAVPSIGASTTCSGPGILTATWSDVSKVNVAVIECTAEIAGNVAVGISRSVLMTDGVAPGETIEPTKAISGAALTRTTMSGGAANWLCWKSASIGTATAACAASGSSGTIPTISVGTSTTVDVCGGASVATALWTDTTQLSVAVIECSSSTVAVGISQSVSMTIGPTPFITPTTAQVGATLTAFTYRDRGDVAVGCAVCPAGFYCNDGIMPADCIESAKWCPQGSSWPTLVPKGWFRGVYGNAIHSDGKSVSLCDPGFICNDGVRVTCDGYVPVRYAPYAGMAECMLVAPGFDRTAADVAQPCAPGSFCYEGISQHCQPGRFASIHGSSVCRLCDHGRYATPSNSTTCLDCPAKYYCPMNTTNPIACSTPGWGGTQEIVSEGIRGGVSGTVETSTLGASTAIFTITNSGSGVYTFIVTTPGSNYDSGGESIVVPGDLLGGTTPDNDATLTVIGTAGPTALSASNVVITGTPAMNAFWCPALASTPLLIPSGRYRGELGGSTVLCPRGHRCSIGVKHACVPGKYASHYGSSACWRCEAGKFTEREASPACEICIGGKFCPEGTSTPRNCSHADANVYCPNGTHVEVPVPHGSVRLGILLANTRLCAPGHWCDSGIETPCSIGRFAAYEGATACTECWSGYVELSTGSTACAHCREGYYCPRFEKNGVLRGSFNETPCDTSHKNFPDIQGGVGGTVETSNAGASTAIFTITNPGNGAYTFTVTTAGSNYDSSTAGGESIVAQGDLLGGESPANDATLTVIGTAGLTALSGSNVVVTGTPAATLNNFDAHCYAGYTAQVYTPSGRYRMPGSPLTTVCPTGYMCALGIKSPCGNGTFSPTEGQMICTQCPSGRWTNLTSTNACDECPAGFACGDGTAKPIACDTNGTTYCPPRTHGTRGYVTPRGRFSSTFRNEAIMCEPGYECHRGITHPCLPGRFANEMGSTKCDECEAGTYADANAMTACVRCKVGHSCPPGANFSRLCPQDTNVYCPNQTAYPVPTPFGFFRLPDRAHVEQCEGGFACSDGVRTPCTGAVLDINGISLVAGTHAPSSGSHHCKTCSPGRYTLFANATMCYMCPEEHYCSGPDPPAKCQGERPEARTPPGSPECLGCPAGEIRYQGACVICPGGSFCDGRSSVALPCPIDINIYCPPGASAPQIIRGGFWKKSMSEIEVCNEGEACFDGQQKTCTNGTFARTEKMVACQDCAAGKYCPRAGMSAEIMCPAGTFNGEVGKSMCAQCIEGEYTIEGTIGNRVCLQCVEGKFARGRTQCPNCPLSGVECSKGVLTILDGWWYIEDPNPPANVSSDIPSWNWHVSVESKFYQCINRKACVMNPINRTVGCATGYQGVICGACEWQTGWTRSGKKCSMCADEGTNISMAVGSVIGLVIFLLWAIVWKDNTEALLSAVLIRIMMSYIQMMGVLGVFAARGTSFFRSLVDTPATFLGGSISDLPFVKCLLRSSFLLMFSFTMLMPIFVCAIAFALVLIIVPTMQLCCQVSDQEVHRLPKLANKSVGEGIKLRIIFLCKRVRRRIVQGMDESGDGSVSLAEGLYRVQSVLVFVIYSMYPNLVKGFSQVFQCSDPVNGKNYLIADLAVQCYVGQHILTMMIAAVCALVYGVGIPAGIFLLLRARPICTRIRGELAMSFAKDKWYGMFPNDIRFISRFGFIFMGYSTDRGWLVAWEAIVMCRKLVITLIATLGSRDPYLQILASLLLLVASYGLHERFLPFENAALNKIEAGGIFCLIWTQTLSIIYLYSDARAEQEGTEPSFLIEAAVTVLLTIANVGMMVWLVGTLLHLLAKERLFSAYAKLIAGIRRCRKQLVMSEEEVEELEDHEQMDRAAAVMFDFFDETKNGWLRLDPFIRLLDEYFTPRMRRMLAEVSEEGRPPQNYEYESDSWCESDDEIDPFAYLDLKGFQALWERGLQVAIGKFLFNGAKIDTLALRHGDDYVVAVRGKLESDGSDDDDGDSTAAGKKKKKKEKKEKRLMSSEEDEHGSEDEFDEEIDALAADEAAAMALLVQSLWEEGAADRRTRRASIVDAIDVDHNEWNDNWHKSSKAHHAARRQARHTTRLTLTDEKREARREARRVAYAKKQRRHAPKDKALPPGGARKIVYAHEKNRAQYVSKSARNAPARHALMTMEERRADAQRTGAPQHFRATTRAQLIDALVGDAQDEEIDSVIPTAPPVLSRRQKTQNRRRGKRRGGRNRERRGGGGKERNAGLDAITSEIRSGVAKNAAINALAQQVRVEEEVVEAPQYSDDMPTNGGGNIAIDALAGQIRGGGIDALMVQPKAPAKARLRVRQKKKKRRKKKNNALVAVLAGDQMVDAEAVVESKAPMKAAGGSRGRRKNKTKKNNALVAALALDIMGGDQDGTDDSEEY